MRPLTRVIALSCVIGACSTRPSSQMQPEPGLVPEGVAEQIAVPDIPRDPADRVIYMVLTDRFKNGDPGNDGPNADPTGLLTWHGGDFRGLTQSLDYLGELGVNTLWITPIVEQIAHPVDWEGNLHYGFHGYWAENFDRLEPRLGTADELHAVLEAAHARGLDVLLDVVLNHPGYRSHFADDRTWTRQCEEEWTNDLTQCLFGLPDFLTEDPRVAAQLIEWQVQWFRDFAFDGVRADTVKHVETAVWRDFLAAVRAVRVTDPAFFALGEWWGTAPNAEEPMLASGMFDAMYDFEFDSLVEGWLNGRMRSEAMGHHLARRSELARGRYVHYLNTHDTALMTGRLEQADAYALALVLLLTTDGIPLLYYGDEVAREGSAWPHNRPDMPWVLTAPQEEILDLTRQLVALRNDRPALRRGAHEELQAENGLVTFVRSLGDERLIVGVNRGPEPAPMTSCPDNAVCSVVFCHRCRADGTAMQLEPFGAAIYEQTPVTPP